MKEYLVSHDYLDGVPIELSQIFEIAFDPQTPDDYAGYLLYVLQKASTVVKTLSNTLDSVQFTVHPNGCILPFGEGGHSFCLNFFSWVKQDQLPPFPDEIQKAG